MPSRRDLSPILQTPRAASPRRRVCNSPLFAALRQDNRLLDRSAGVVITLPFRAFQLIGGTDALKFPAQSSLRPRVPIVRSTSFRPSLHSVAKMAQTIKRQGCQIDASETAVEVGYCLTVPGAVLYNDHTGGGASPRVWRAIPKHNGRHRPYSFGFGPLSWDKLVASSPAGTGQTAQSFAARR